MHSVSEFVGEFHDEDGGCWGVDDKYVYRSSSDNCAHFYWAPQQEDDAYRLIGWLKNSPMVCNHHMINVLVCACHGNTPISAVT